MLYQLPGFSCPAAPPNLTERQWDFATLTKAEFVEKYGITAAAYERLKQGE